MATSVGQEEFLDVFLGYEKMIYCKLKIGYGFVLYETVESRNLAIQNLSGTQLGNKIIHVE